MSVATITLNTMAHGGFALGRDRRGRTIFVPGGIPGERVRVELTQRGRRLEGHITEVVKPAKARVTPRCTHFGVCGGCHFQHIDYREQARLKETLVRDQLRRVGKLKKPRIRPIIPHPAPYEYRNAITFSPASASRLGLWSPTERRVIPIDRCHLPHPDLQTLYAEIDLDLRDLRKLTLRLDDDGARLLALAVNYVEPPQLASDLPVSITILFPDNTAATLIGDPFLYYTVRGREFRISSGVSIWPSTQMADALVDAVLEAAALHDDDVVVDAYSGAGVLTAFLAEVADAVVGIDSNEDAISDAAVNLDNSDNVSLILDTVEATLETLPPTDVLLLDPPDSGVSAEALSAILDYRPKRIVYSAANLGAFAQDARRLTQVGYQLDYVQPLDMAPQTFHIHTVSAWRTARTR